MVTAKTTAFFICGSALSGQPDHHTLGEARFVKAVRTAALYRLYDANDGWHPAIRPAQAGETGIAIPGEVYALSEAQLVALLASEPPDLVRSSVALDNGETITAMLCPQATIDEKGWPDISHYDGWAAYKAAPHNDAGDTMP
ncbi:allophanate hydrolase protein [Salinisphaera shabanensis E1L3A]|uniref:Allophanate hydrolase protein n=1 Tax=Salinisphaera shabanensis E1L3A TaxID=1033802 RepID=U2EP75_9GAMM|nr:gamma-glutamylcyclotransferase [Salinisphaera shabanensis]ERJ19610.1 allophanate hydrolase protein [Salinisphaera shabanensis E1L3A]